MHPILTLALLLTLPSPTWTQSPVVQTDYLKASNPEAGDVFGVDVGVDADTAVVGAVNESSVSSTVDGNQADNSANQAGAAYVFTRQGGAWGQQAYLKASNASAFDEFGVATKISGDTIVVGAYFEDSGATGVNGDQLDNSVTDSGAAYVFVRTGTTWTQQAYLKASNPSIGDGFGLRCAIDGDTIVVAAPYEDSSATGTNSPVDNADATDSGAVYVYERSGDTWALTARLKASNTNALDNFGYSIAVDDDLIIVGADFEDSASDESDNSSQDSGAAYVFRRTPSGWQQEAFLKSSNADPLDRFGTWVSTSAGRIAVSANWEDSGSSGVSGDSSDNSLSDSGAVYVFEQIGSSWTETAYLKASNPGAGDRFGLRQGLSNSTLVVSTNYEQSTGTGLTADPLDNSGTLVGAAYVFRELSGSWLQTAYVKPDALTSSYFFGRSLGVSGDLFITGATGDSSSGSGVNPSNVQLGSPGSGAAHVYSLDLAQCVERTAGNNVPSYSSTLPRTGQPWTGTVDLSTTGHFGALLIGFLAPTNLPLPTGDVLLVGPQFPQGEILQLGAQAGPLANFAVNIPQDVALVGLAFYSQAIHFGGIAPLRLSNALDCIIGL